MGAVLSVPTFCPPVPSNYLRSSMIEYRYRNGGTHGFP